MRNNSVSIQEAAEHLGISCRSLMEKLKNKKIPIGVAVQFAGRWVYFINRNQLEEFSGRDLYYVEGGK